MDPTSLLLRDLEKEVQRSKRVSLCEKLEYSLASQTPPCEVWLWLNIMYSNFL